MTDTCKLIKLVDRIHKFSSQLEQTKEISVHQRINHFYYMQKEAELLALAEQFEETQRRLAVLATLIDKEYETIFMQWRKDIRWITRQRIANTH